MKLNRRKIIQNIIISKRKRKEKKLKRNYENKKTKKYKTNTQRKMNRSWKCTVRDVILHV